MIFDGDSVTGSFDFQTTRQGVYEFMEKVPEGSIAAIESSTTGTTTKSKIEQLKCSTLNVEFSHNTTALD